MSQETPPMSRAFAREDPNDPLEKDFGLPDRSDPGFDEAAARVLLEAARGGDTEAAERATGYYWGEQRLKPYVQRILEEALRAGDERLEQLARRFVA
jgi:hypothetical protein